MHVSVRSRLRSRFLACSPIALKELDAEYFMTILFEREMSLLRECLKNCSMDWGHLHGRFEGGKRYKVTLSQ